MRKKAIQILFVLLLTLLLPYLATMLFTQINFSTLSSEVRKITIYNEAKQKKDPINLETYLVGVLAATIPVNYEPETMKAQAVIARTYALKNIATLRKQTSATTSFPPKISHSYSTKEIGLSYIDPASLKTYMEKSQYVSYIKSIKEAVKATKNEVITYKNKLITPLFFSTSAGTTRDPRAIWEIPFPYLKSVKSKKDLASPDYLNITVDTIPNVISKLNQAFQSRLLDLKETTTQQREGLSLTEENFFDSVKVIKRDPYGYVLTVCLGDIYISGESFANTLQLNSTNFYIEDYEDNVRFICNGKGHGIGFSQFGANELAKNKSTYTALLKYYYTDIAIKPLHKISIFD